MWVPEKPGLNIVVYYRPNNGKMDWEILCRSVGLQGYFEGSKSKGDEPNPQELQSMQDMALELVKAAIDNAQDGFYSIL